MTTREQTVRRLSDQFATLLRHGTARLRDPRQINPMVVFAGGLSVLLPIWFLFLNH